MSESLRDLQIATTACTACICTRQLRLSHAESLFHNGTAMTAHILFFVTGWSEEDGMGNVEQYLSLCYTSFEFFTRFRRRNFKLCHGTELEWAGEGGV
jgi:hypothetical protein